MVLLLASGNKVSVQLEFPAIFCTGFRELSSVVLLPRTEPAGLHLLLPMQQRELLELLTQGHCFPWCFRVKVAGHILLGAWSSEFLCMLGSRTYHQVMEPGAAR
jgi:hypothetical protein